MLNKSLFDEDIIMKDHNCSFPYYFSFSNFIRPKKRRYIEMLSETNQKELNIRIDNYKISAQAEKNNSILNFTKNNEEDNKLIVINYDVFNNINKSKKNFLGKKRYDFDEERERKLVENYYKIKNAELNKLRFGYNS